MLKSFASVLFASIITQISNAYGGQTLPDGFVDLHQIAPDIQYDIRYASDHNFVGRPIKGYDAAECVLTKPAALALANVEKELLKSSLSLKVYDCYRPQQAVNDFMAWSQQPGNQETKTEFYPRTDKDKVFELNYVAQKSGHTRGSTIDLTIVSLPSSKKESTYHKGQPLVSCYAPYLNRFDDGSIDMGTGHDCLDVLAGYSASPSEIGVVAYQNRLLLKTLMEKYGFEPIPNEWWHFTLKNEPYPETYFDFPIT